MANVFIVVVFWHLTMTTNYHLKVSTMLSWIYLKKEFNLNILQKNRLKNLQINTPQSNIVNVIMKANTKVFQFHPNYKHPPTN
jgi:hypothetical protein